VAVALQFESLLHAPFKWSFSQQVLAEQIEFSPAHLAPVLSSAPQPLSLSFNLHIHLLDALSLEQSVVALFAIVHVKFGAQLKSEPHG